MPPRRRPKSSSLEDVTPNPKRGKQSSAGEMPTPSSETKPKEMTPKLKNYVVELLQKVDEIHDTQNNIYEWLEQEIHAWPDGAAGWAAAMDEKFPAEGA